VSSDITISNKIKKRRDFTESIGVPKDRMSEQEGRSKEAGFNTDQRFHKEQGCHRGERFATRTRTSQGETYVTGCRMSRGLGLKQEQKCHREQAVHKERGCS
jgi:hypothetical protein